MNTMVTRWKGDKAYENYFYTDFLPVQPYMQVWSSLNE